MFAIVLASFLSTLVVAKLGEPFTSSQVTIRDFEMTDSDQTTCLTHFNRFVLAGPTFPIIGMGEHFYRDGIGCNQCVQLEHKGKFAYGIMGDLANTGKDDQLDLSPLLASQLGFTPLLDGGIHPFNNPDAAAVKVKFISCGTRPELNLGGHLQYIFGPGSKATSLEMAILGNYHPISSVTLQYDKSGPLQGVREAGKFRFLSGVSLRDESVLTFTVTMDDGSVITDTFTIKHLVNPYELRLKTPNPTFFKSGNVGTDKEGNDQVNPAVLNWKDYVNGTTKQK